ncbi:MAG: organic solvent tolerance protein, LPS-assembly protein [Candidatus Rokubacteria bacterium CSP1-6]|nr:MAG: organic solvent tolerance protein, LPS-assembly protein [Candidatus Rokubacteria bacterium CSP1-6]
MMRIATGPALVFACLVLTTSALAQAPVTVPAEGGDVSILADRMDQVGSLLIGIGNVEITKGSSRLTADRVEINRETGEAVAQGKVIFYDGQDRLLGDRIDYNLKTGTGVVYNGSAFSAPYYRISGERMERVGEGVYNIQRGVFTTCEGDPPLWSFGVGRATADLDDYIVGRDASFWVGKVPLIPWVPFFAAALRRERQSGFLFPTFGNSSRKGVFARIPYYWAISDSQDATISLEPYSKRGVGAGGEYRYILSESNRGIAQGFFIRETERDDRERGDDPENRGNVIWKHAWQISPRLSFKTDLNMVTDDRFYREYGDRLRERSQQRAESNVFATYSGDSWNLVGRAFWYQDLTTLRPVELQRAPEIRFQSFRQPIRGASALLFETEASFTNFVRDVGSDGRRLDLHPRVFLPISVDGYFTVTPFVGGRATYYDTRVIGNRLTLNGRIPVEETRDASFVRALGEVGADLEARAMRIYDVGGAAGISRLQHLIEPRVNITEIQGVNDKGLPRWDPGGGLVNPLAAPLADIGVDRFGRISRLTYSLTNRLNAKTVAGPGQEAVRWELVRFSLAQTYDLPPNKHSERFGDLAGDLLIEPNQHFRFRGDARYDVYGRGIQSVNSDISAMFWDVTATAGTRFDDRANVEFVRGEILAKLSRYLDVRASTNYDIKAGTNVESRVGVDVHCQCAAISVTYINRGAKGVGRSEDEVNFSVNLLGVGQVGSRPGQ